MKEVYVSFDVAKLLKEKGFDWECHHFYYCKNNGKIVEKWIQFIADRNSDRWINPYAEYVSAPTQQMACDWLRDKQIDILPDCSLVDRKYSFHIINRYKTGGEIIHSDEIYDKYEDAIEAALEYCLTKLI